MRLHPLFVAHRPESELFHELRALTNAGVGQPTLARLVEMARCAALPLSSDQ
jgi:hypothetical protein